MAPGGVCARHGTDLGGESSLRIVSSANLNQADKRVKANKAAPGVDGMTVEDLRPRLADHKDERVAQLVRGDYRPWPGSPMPFPGVETPKPGGGRAEREARR